MNYLYETHFHTADVSPCGKIQAADGARLYKNAGYAGILVTDHFGSDYLKEDYKGDTWREKVDYFLRGYRAAKRYESEDFSVMLGFEVRFDENRNDYLIIGADEAFLYDNEGFPKLGVKKFKSLAEKHALLVIQAHPFRKGMTIAEPRDIDGIETFNGNRRHDSANDIAAAWAARCGLMQTSGSDFHQTEDLARGGVYLEKAVRTSSELRRELLTGRYTLKLL